MIEVTLAMPIPESSEKRMTVIQTNVFDVGSDGEAGIAIGYLIASGQVEGVDIGMIARGEVKAGFVKL